MSGKVLVELEIHAAPTAQATGLNVVARWLDEGGNPCADGAGVTTPDAIEAIPAHTLLLLRALCAGVVQKAYDRGHRDAMLERKTLEAEEEIQAGLRASHAHWVDNGR